MFVVACHDVHFLDVAVSLISAFRPLSWIPVFCLIRVVLQRPPEPKVYPAPNAFEVGCATHAKPGKVVLMVCGLFTHQWRRGYVVGGELKACSSG